MQLKKDDQAVTLRSDAKLVSKSDPGLEVRQHFFDLSQSKPWTKPFQLWGKKKGICWEGAWPASLAPLMATVHAAVPRPMLIVVPLAPDAEALARDLEYLTGHSVELFPQGPTNRESSHFCSKRFCNDFKS